MSSATATNVHKLPVSPDRVVYCLVSDFESEAVDFATLDPEAAKEVCGEHQRIEPRVVNMSQVRQRALGRLDPIERLLFIEGRARKLQGDVIVYSLVSTGEKPGGPLLGEIVFATLDKDVAQKKLAEGWTRMEAQVVNMEITVLKALTEFSPVEAACILGESYRPQTAEIIPLAPRAR